MSGKVHDHHVVIVGAGFGGLETVRRLKGAGVRITLVDRRNHHLCEPLRPEQTWRIQGRRLHHEVLLL